MISLANGHPVLLQPGTRVNPGMSVTGSALPPVATVGEG